MLMSKNINNDVSKDSPIDSRKSMKRLNYSLLLNLTAALIN